MNFLGSVGCTSIDRERPSLREIWAWADDITVLMCVWRIYEYWEFIKSNAYLRLQRRPKIPHFFVTIYDAANDCQFQISVVCYAWESCARANKIKDGTTRACLLKFKFKKWNIQNRITPNWYYYQYCLLELCSKYHCYYFYPVNGIQNWNPPSRKVVYLH